MDVLQKLGADGKPMLHVLNKQDIWAESAENDFPEAVRISAKSGEGTDVLLQAIEKRLKESVQRIEISIPYTQAQDEAWVHRNCPVLEEQYTDTGYVLTVEADTSLLGQITHRFHEDCISVPEKV